MNNVSLLAIEATLSITTSVAITWMIARPLKAALMDLCPTEQQANFWLAYTRVMLLITPLLLVLFTSARHSGDMFSDLRAAFIAAFTGLLAGLIIIGRKMYIPVDRQIHKANRGDNV
ncbi:MAG: hypothetical protein HYZ31_12055 [Gammaproteobacteria bacterium]|nr:hypothetical protein [Gammaproteobacteria bacterium]